MREYPENPVPAVGIVILNGDRVLLIQRANEPGRGQWSVPGGAIELGETIQEAAQREAREECGLEVEAGEPLSLYDLIQRDEDGRIRFHYLLIHLAACYQGGEPRPASDALAAGWFTEAELGTLEMPERVRQVIREAWRRPRPGSPG